MITPDSLHKTFLRLGAATLGESGGMLMPPRMKAAWPGAVIAAPAYPVMCSPGDNLGIHVGVASAPQGFVLVVSVGDIAERGYWGEVLTTGAESRGIKGLVIDGGVRDVAALQSHGFPVFSSMIALKGASKVQKGSCGVPTTVAGVTVSLGDWVVADADGVVIVPKDHLSQVLEAGNERAKKEDGFFASLKGGSTTVELLDLDASLIEMGS